MRPRCPLIEARRRPRARQWAERGIGDWRASLERFAEDHAPVHVRRDAAVAAALRALAGRGVRLGVFTDAPEPLARVVLAQLGADRRIDAVEAGDGRAGPAACRSSARPTWREPATI